jgi:glycosyltransferase involved in cell wall biosynthesis
MKISVITVSYNAEATIRHTVESFLAQDHADREMVVIDGASKDATLDIIKSYNSPLIRIFSEPDKGMYDALNKGLKLYSGDAFGVLNADDRYHDDSALSRIVRVLTTHDMAHGHLDFVRNHEGREVVRTWRAENRPGRGFRTGWMPAHPTFYVHRRVADAVGPFDLSYQTASDYDWMLRAIEHHEFSLGMAKGVLVDMMTGGRSTAGIASHVHHNLEALRARQKWLHAGVVDFALIAKPARKLGQYLTCARQAQGVDLK